MSKGKAMLSRKRFRVEIEPRGHETTHVSVTHLHSGIHLSQTVAPSQTNRCVEQLMGSVLRRLASPEDMTIDVGRCVNGMFLRVTHVPSGQSKAQEGLRGRKASAVQEELVNSLVNELWDAGLLPRVDQPEDTVQ